MATGPINYPRQNAIMCACISFSISTFLLMLQHTEVCIPIIVVNVRQYEEGDTVRYELM